MCVSECGSGIPYVMGTKFPHKKGNLPKSLSLWGHWNPIMFHGKPNICCVLSLSRSLSLSVCVCECLGAEDRLHAADTWTFSVSAVTKDCQELTQSYGARARQLLWSMCSYTERVTAHNHWSILCVQRIRTSGRLYRGVIWSMSQKWYLFRDLKIVKYLKYLVFIVRHKASLFNISKP